MLRGCSVNDEACLSSGSSLPSRHGPLGALATMRHPYEHNITRCGKAVKVVPQRGKNLPLSGFPPSVLSPQADREGRCSPVLDQALCRDAAINRARVSSEPIGETMLDQGCDPLELVPVKQPEKRCDIVRGPALAADEAAAQAREPGLEGVT
jgi:hypothetical protein